MPRTARLTIRDHRSTTEVSDLGGAVTTHAGSARIHQLSGPLTLDTHRGEVEVEFSSFTGDSRVVTHRGRIELALPTGARFNLQADIGRGAELNSDFPLMTRVVGRRERSFSSTNGSGPMLRVETHGGNIRLRAR